MPRKKLLSYTDTKEEALSSQMKFKKNGIPSIIKEEDGRYGVYKVKEKIKKARAKMPKKSYAIGSPEWVKKETGVI